MGIIPEATALDGCQLSFAWIYHSLRRTWTCAMDVGVIVTGAPAIKMLVVTRTAAERRDEMSTPAG